MDYQDEVKYINMKCTSLMQYYGEEEGEENHRTDHKNFSDQNILISQHTVKIKIGQEFSVTSIFKLLKPGLKSPPNEPFNLIIPKRKKVRNPTIEFFWYRNLQTYKIKDILAT